MKTIILGPPGTGKTTTLLELVDDFMQAGIDSRRIGYFSFTKKAATEAQLRAMDKFDLSDKDLPYFKTLHSLAFQVLGLNKAKVMQNTDYQDFGKKCGIPITIRSAYHSDEDGTFTSDNEYLQMIQKSVATERDVMDVYDDNNHYIDIERDTLYLLDQELKRYKKEKGMCDYGDMLQRFITFDQIPSFDVLFIDEAQDLSPIQWKMVRALWQRSEKTYIAGDDDQAIFEWAGADVDHFIALRDEVDTVRVLDQSYRIPGGPIHELSQSIISKVSNRYEKKYKPRAGTGILQRYSDLTQVDMSQGEWLVLSSANYFLEDVKDLCEQKGWYYAHKGRNSVSIDLLIAIENWGKWIKGERLSCLHITNIYEYLGDNVTRGYRKGKTLDTTQFYSIEECIADHGLQTKEVWFKSFAGLDTYRENYIRNMLRNEEKIKKTPRIILSSIHSIKGGEADNVLVLPDITRSAQVSDDRDPDVLHRLFYVAVTRAKKELHIMEPRNYERAYPL